MAMWRSTDRILTTHGTDCGIGSRVGHPEIVWAKLAAMSEGAALASERLWR
jgi:5-methyltetrahydropteroyltriglutamate--homocysteine methyltransferase